MWSAWLPCPTAKGRIVARERRCLEDRTSGARSLDRSDQSAVLSGGSGNRRRCRRARLELDRRPNEPADAPSPTPVEACCSFPAMYRQAVIGPLRMLRPSRPPSATFPILALPKRPTSFLSLHLPPHPRSPLTRTSIVRAERRSRAVVLRTRRRKGRRQSCGCSAKGHLLPIFLLRVHLLKACQYLPVHLLRSHDAPLSLNASRPDANPKRGSAILGRERASGISRASLVTSGDRPTCR